jgi:tetratricopeptide (TPR) repeat protein
MQKQMWLGHVNVTRAVVMDLLARLGPLVSAGNNTEALSVGEAGLKDLQSAIARHEAALKNLQAQARKAGLTDEAQLAPAEQRAFDELTQWKDSLAGTVREIRVVVDKANDPAIKQALGKIEQAKLLEKQAEYGKALALYEAALPALPDGGNKPKLQARVNELRAQWKIKNDKHKDARQFIYETWPTLTTGTAIADNLDRARKAFAVCKSVGDRLTVSKLWLASAAQINVLAKEKAALSSLQGEEAEKKKKTLLKLSADLAAFYKDVSSFLAGK